MNFAGKPPVPAGAGPEGGPFAALPAAPHNLEAEQALLGAILFDNQMFFRLPEMQGRQFYDPVHGRIFDVMAGRIRAGKLADGLTMREWFATEGGGLAEIGGAGYLLVLMENAARLTSQAKDYADLIIDLCVRRDVIAVLRDGEQLVTEGDADGMLSAPEILAQIEADLRAIDTGDATGGKTLAEAGASLIVELENPKRGLKTGLKKIDKRIGGLFPQDLIIIAGRPGMGKSLLAANIARNVARDHLINDEIVKGAKVHFASYEMSAESLAARSLSDHAYRSGGDAFAYSELRQDPEKRTIDLDRLRRLQAGLSKNLIIDDCAAQTIGKLDASVRRTRRRLGGLDLVIVDYLQLMAAISRGGRVEQITEISQGLKAMAKRLDIPVIALSQLSRAVESRDDKRPILADLRESGSIEQDADIVMFCYREAYYLKQQEPQMETTKPRDGMSKETTYNIDHSEWFDRLHKVDWQMEIGAAKVRSGETGSDIIKAIMKYDVAEDWPE
jgi:replicative DNA helicase